MSNNFSFDDTHLYIEWFTMDTSVDQLSRTALNVWAVLGNVGGIQQVLLSIVVAIIGYYSQISFVIEAICAMFDVKCIDESLQWEER
jgi:hypothetical protein